MSPSVMKDELLFSFGIASGAGATFSIITSVYYWSYNPVLIPAGVMIDKYGPRIILTFATLICAVGALVFASTNSLYVALFGRFLIGFGSAFAFAGALKLATIWLPANKFAMAAGLTTTLGMLSSSGGQKYLPGIVDNIGWNNTVWYFGLLGIAILSPIMWGIVRDAPRRVRARAYLKPEFSYVHLILVVKQLLRNKQIWTNGLIGCFLYLPVIAFAEGFAPSFYVELYGISKGEAGSIVAFMYIGWGLFSPVIGFASDYVGRRKLPLLLGTIAAMCCYIAMVYYPFNVWQAKVLMFIFGACTSTKVLSFPIGKENCAPSNSGTAVATTNFLIMLGGLLFTPIIGIMLDFGSFYNFLSFIAAYLLKIISFGYIIKPSLIAMAGGPEIINGVARYSVEAYREAFLIFPIGYIISILLCLFLKETYAKQLVEDPPLEQTVSD